MATNSGKPSERDFEARLDGLGKRAYYHRLVDAAEVKGRTGRLGFSRPMPSDYVVVLDGHTFFAEVKSTTHKTAFSFGLLRTKQSADATMIIGAGGTYDVFVHRVETNEWFRFSYALVAAAKARGRASLQWSELEPYRWTL